MPLRSLFVIILKVIGILFINSIIESAVQLIGIAYSYFVYSASMAVVSVAFGLLTMGVYVGLAYLSLFKTHYIIDRLRLTDNLPESVNIKVPKTIIIEIALIATAGVVLFEQIPNLIRYLFKYWQERGLTYGEPKPELSYSVFAGIKILLALLLFGERRRIVAFLSEETEPNQVKP